MTLDTRILILAALSAALVGAPAAVAQQQPPCGVTYACPEEPAPPVPEPTPPAPVPPDPRGVDPASPNPLIGLDFFVDRTWSPAYNQYRRYVRRGQRYNASLVGKIALQPQFKWFGRWNENDKGHTAGVMRAYIERVNEEQPGSVPQIVTLRHQGKGCNHRYKAGGVGEDERTKRWFDAFARGVGDARVVIGFEPDSLGTVDCLARSRRQARLDVLRYGVDVLSKLPNATIYLEAGASDWESAARTAKQLRYIGISKVRGFMLNVTHYSWTGYNIKHGLDISRQVGGKPFIISTSFNGRGPVHYKRWVNRANNIWRRVNVWCHPLMRGLGPAPTTKTAHPKVDAYFYIGRPGYSGGSCNGGPLPVGSWFEERALMFGKYATDWLLPPRNTVNGHVKRYRARVLAGDQYQP
ncbi:MAG TPA: glycoside hydrolase family 6 protein [Thermoleophilaceae bacterium]|nr:glycoside hydrolase family 6 protein [Thermoleophilaceae bacterium]